MSEPNDTIRQHVSHRASDDYARGYRDGHKDGYATGVVVQPQEQPRRFTKHLAELRRLSENDDDDDCRVCLYVRNVMLAESAPERHR